MRIASLGASSVDQKQPGRMKRNSVYISIGKGHQHKHQLLYIYSFIHSYYILLYLVLLFIFICCHSSPPSPVAGAYVHCGSADIIPGGLISRSLSLSTLSHTLYGVQLPLPLHLHPLSLSHPQKHSSPLLITLPCASAFV